MIAKSGRTIKWGGMGLYPGLLKFITMHAIIQKLSILKTTAGYYNL